VPAEELKPRDWRIMELVAQGLSNAEIARKINCTTETTKNYLVQILDHTGMDNRTGLALWYTARQMRGEIPQ